MEVSIKSQLLAIFYAIILGVILGIIYDFLRIFRVLLLGSYDLKLKNRLLRLKIFNIINIEENKRERSSKTEKIIIFLFDLLYFIVITPILAVFIYATSSGIVRWYLFFGFGVGIIIHFLTVRRIFKPVYETLIFLIRITVEYIKYPFKMALKRLKMLFKRKKIRKKRKLPKKQEQKSRTELIYTGKAKAPDSN